MANWTIDLDNIIYTAIKTKLLNAFQPKYPDFYVTNSSVSPDVARFPTVFIQPISNTEAGETLEGDVICGVNYGLQIEVTTKAADISVAKAVMSEAVGIMKGMLFRGGQLPLYENTKDTYRMIARFRREIAEGDSLNFG